MECPNWKALLNEAYLITGSDIKKGETTYSASGCKYPHHKIVGGKLVVSEKGVKAAFSRAKQTGVFKGDVKSHLEKHYRELGLLKGSAMEENSSLVKIEQNFNDIKVMLESMEAKSSNLKPVFILARNIDATKFAQKSLPAQQRHSVIFSTVLKVATGGDNYSHSGISFDDSFKEIYSFNSVTDHGGGFIAEKIDGIQWLSSSVYVAVCFLDESSLARMKKIVENFKTKDLNKTKYQFSHLLRLLANKTKNQDFRFICSTFVGYLLFMGDPKLNSKTYNSLRPEDMTILPRTFYVMNIKYDDWKEGSGQMTEFRERVKKIFNDHKAEIEDYNNHLPKMMIQKEITKASDFDNFIDNIINKLYRMTGV